MATTKTNQTQNTKWKIGLFLKQDKKKENERKTNYWGERKNSVTEKAVVVKTKAQIPKIPNMSANTVPYQIGRPQWSDLKVALYTVFWVFTVTIFLSCVTYESTVML